jgi:hypothetical protein
LRGGALYIFFFGVFGSSLFLRPAGLGSVPHPSLVPIFIFFEKLVLKIKSGPIIFWGFIAVALPGAITFFIVYILFGSKLSNYGPYSFWNDEVAYWVWLRSFSFVGFNSGYNAPNEILPVFEFSRYGEASPFYLYVYGAVSRLVGWSNILPILINLLFVSFSIFLFIRFAKLDAVQIIFVSLVIVTSWPILLYLPMTTHESLNQAFGIVFSITFINLIAFRSRVHVIAKWLFVLFLCFATFVRLSWGLLLIPTLFYVLAGSTLKRGVVSILAGSVIYVFAILLTGYFLPPLNNSIFTALKGGVMLLKILRDQVYYMFVFNKLTPNIGVTFQMSVVIVWSVARMYKMKRSGVSLSHILDGFDMFDFYIIASLLFAGFIFYLQEGFYRTFAPTMLIFYLLQVFRRNYRSLSVFLVLNLLFFSSYMNFYGHVGDFQIIRADYTRGFVDGPQIQAEIERFIRFDPDAISPWCNTMLIPLDYYDARLILVPPGIGISYILQPSTFQFPAKSRYILFDADTYEIYKNDVNLEHLTSLPIGDLYLNFDVNCR